MCDVNNLPLDDMKRGPLLNIRGYEVIRCYVMHRLVLLQCCFAFFYSAHVLFGLETTEMEMCSAELRRLMSRQPLASSQNQRWLLPLLLRLWLQLHQ